MSRTSRFKKVFGLRTSSKKEEVIENSRPDHLYTHTADRVRFYRIVSEEQHSTTYQASKRTQVQLTQKLSNGEFETLEIVKTVDGKEKQRITLPNFTLENICGFLHLMKGIGIDGYDKRRSLIVNDAVGEVDRATREAIVDVLSGEQGTSIVQGLLHSGALNEKDLINTGYRRQQLGIYHALLYKGYINQYKINVMKSSRAKDEIAWQHFFAQNEWIFGYGLTYRFNTILQKEFAASGTTAAGKDQVNVDFLTADTRFTSFVELKKPDTPLFGSGLNRSRAWSLSGYLQDAKSQILEQKASGMIKAETEKDLTTDQGELIRQRTFDPRVILVIGCWNQLDGDNHTTATAKRKTFELFRRDSRNVEFITYDELYERACHIVGDSVPATT